MRRETGPGRTSPRTWSWPVFLGSFTWSFYRKMYALGAMLIFLPPLFTYLFGSVGGATWILFAGSAKGWYVNLAVERVFKADQLGLAGAEREDYLRRAGGVSLPAGIFAGFIFAFALALAIMAVIGSRHAVTDDALPHRSGRDRSVPADAGIRDRQGARHLEFRGDA